MPKLRCKLECVTCKNTVEEWYTKDSPHNWKFFSKCNSCSVMNVFYVPREFSFDEVTEYIYSSSVQVLLSIEEIDRLNRVKIRYNIPDHIPVAQFEKYKNKKKAKQYKDAFITGENYVFK